MPNYPSSTNKYPGTSGVVDHPGTAGHIDHPSSITDHGGFPSVITFNTLVTSVTCLQAVQSDLGITQSGVVSAWADQSGSGKDYSASGTAQPTYNASGLNGFPTLTFDGSDDTMTSALSLPAPGTTPTFLWMVFRQLSWTLNDCIVGALASRMVIRQAGVSPALVMVSATAANSNNAAATNSWVRMEAFFNNNTTDFLKLAATSVTGANAGNFSGGGNQNLGSINTPGAWGNIEVAALMYFSGLPSVAERAALAAAVTAKYGASVGV